MLKGKCYSRVAIELGPDRLREGGWRNGPDEEMSGGGVEKATQWNADVQIRRAQLVWEPQS